MLIPFGLQFAHAFESHEVLDCHTEKQEHLHEHEFDCAVFHFKINTEATRFTSLYEWVKIEFPYKEICSSSIDIKPVKINYESSRAPPILLF